MHRFSDKLPSSNFPMRHKWHLIAVFAALSAALSASGCAGSSAPDGGGTAAVVANDAATGDAAASETATGSDTLPLADAPPSPADTAADAVDGGAATPDAPAADAEDGAVTDAASASEVGPDAAAPESDTAPPADTAPANDTASANDSAPSIDVPPAVCLPTEPSKEVCDGLDNDCNGSTDQPSDGEVPPCNDGNSCTVDACAGKLGCKSTPCIGASCGLGCDDGNACTLSDQCAAGTCKAGAAKCNDGNVCTTDSCDAKTGDCAFSPVVGCKACAVVVDCNDANACTTDACTAGVCAWKAIVGCIGPPDYKAISLVLDKNTFPLPGQGGAQFKMRNDGQAFGAQTQAQKLKWEMWLSVDASIGPGDFQVGPTTIIDGYNIGDSGLPNAQVEKTVAIWFAVAKEADVPPGAKFLCARIVGAADTDQTNNAICVPMPTPKFMEYKLTALSLGGADAIVGDQSGVLVTYGNQEGPVDIQVPIALFASVDATWDATDIALVDAKLPALLVGVSKQDQVNLYWPASVKPEHKFLCGVVNLAGLAKEPTPDDNAKCVAMTVINLPDISAAADAPGFVTKAGLVVGNPTWGVEYGCNASLISNIGYATAQSFAMRCWLSPTGAGPDGTLWQVAWQNQVAVPAASFTGVWPSPLKKTNGFALNVAAPTQAALKMAAFGEHTLCMELNYDAKLVEKVWGPPVCHKVQVTGTDFHNLGAAYGLLFPNNLTEKIPAQVLTRGVPYYLRWGIHNLGNALLTDAKKLVGKALLSKDGNASADDYVIWEGNLQTIYNNITAYGGIQNGWLHTMDVKIALPLTLDVGAYNVIYVLNHTQGLLEPSVGKETSTAITLK